MLHQLAICNVCAVRIGDRVVPRAEPGEEEEDEGGEGKLHDHVQTGGE